MTDGPNDAFWSPPFRIRALLVLLTALTVILAMGGANWIGIGRGAVPNAALLSAQAQDQATDAAERQNTATATAPHAPPYPPSKVITDLTWHSDTFRLGDGNTGDNWPITWADDGLLYTAYGDGYGFNPNLAPTPTPLPTIPPSATGTPGTPTPVPGPPHYSIGFAAVSGTPPQPVGTNFPSNIDVYGYSGNAGIKASGLLSVNGVLYLFVRNYQVNGDYQHSRLAWSYDHGSHWRWASWYFSDTFGCPDFIQFGRDYAGARDNYVYIVSQSGNNAYARDPSIVMARVPLDQVANRRLYQFYAGADASGHPVWSADIDQRQPIFTDPNGTQRIGLSYNAPLHRYILTSSHDDGTGATHTTALGVFDAPQPWGPWTTVYYDDHWSAGATYEQKFVPKWTGRDGKTMWLLYSGFNLPTDPKCYNCFVMKEATLTTP